MASDAIVVLTDSNFDEQIKSDLPVLVDFWATWCGPCRMLAPVIDEVAQEMQGKLVVGKLDVDDNPATAQKFGVMSIPTLIVFKNGEVAKTLVGFMSKRDLVDKLSDVL